MKSISMKLIMLMAVMMPLVFIAGCDKDDDHDDNHNHNNNNTGALQYHAHIISPDTTAKKVNETLQIKVQFEEHDGDKVHHVQVRIFNSDDNSQLVFDEPAEKHVHADGEYTFEESFILSNANGVTEHTDWTLEAKVWGHEAGEGEAISTVDFHVHPE